MISLRVGLVLGLLVLSAFFAACETALFSLRQHHLQALRTQTTASSRAILKLLDEPRRLLTTILVGNTVVNLLLSVVASGIFVTWLGPERGSVVATLVMTVIVLVVGEISPKTVAVGAPMRLGLRLVLPLVLVSRALRPVTTTTVRLVDAIREVLARRWKPREEALTEAEIKTLVTMGWEQGVVGAREKEFIHNVFHLDDRQLKGIVTPRSQVFTADADSEIDDLRRSIREAGYSRVPLYSGSHENLIGYVEVTDLLWGQEIPDPRRLRDLMHDLHFYPESKRVGELLPEMLRLDQEIAAVVDEHGDYVGVVSLEDAAEEVVGEIFDQHDLDRFRHTTLPNGEILIAAQMQISAFNQLLDVHLEDPQAETIGGFVLNHLGRIPTTHEGFEVDGLFITVVQAAPNRVVKLLVRRTSPEA